MQYTLRGTPSLTQKNTHTHACEERRGRTKASWEGFDGTCRSVIAKAWKIYKASQKMHANTKVDHSSQSHQAKQKLSARTHNTSVHPSFFPFAQTERWHRQPSSCVPQTRTQMLAEGRFQNFGRLIQIMFGTYLKNSTAEIWCDTSPPESPESSLSFSHSSVQNSLSISL